MVTPYALRDAPALIERLLPVQKLSAEAYKEQMAVQGKTLTALGSYWKGRKPLILNRACILASLLPATENPSKDLEIFEKLMAMDDESIAARWKKRPKPREIITRVPLPRVGDYFDVDSSDIASASSPIAATHPGLATVKVTWRSDVSESQKRRIETAMLPPIPYRARVDEAARPEEIGDEVSAHIWPDVNAYLGTDAQTLPQLVEQLGIMRFGHRPKVADTFCGSGQIPFEAARMGCDVYASDLSPIACMLTWGALRLVGGSVKDREALVADQAALVKRVLSEIDALDIESDGAGWRAKVYLYCLEARCPQTGWMVPLLPTFMVSKGHHTVVELVPDTTKKRYDIILRSGLSKEEFSAAAEGTVRTEGRGQDPYMVHTVEGTEYRTKISTLRGDYRTPEGGTSNRLRRWQNEDIVARSDDTYQERLYCIQWMRARESAKTDEYEFRAITPEDLAREDKVNEYVAARLSEWQASGWIPQMRIESGDETDRLARERGWTHWHHLFNPRQLLLASIINRHSDARLKLGFAQVLNASSRLTRWSLGDGDGRSGGVKGVFDNQALNTLFNYGCRASYFAVDILRLKLKSFPLPSGLQAVITNHPAAELTTNADVFVTDPPYGDAVKYEEILEYFIAWLAQAPPPEFEDWTWDSRRSLAIKGEDEDFRRGMVAAYRAMTDRMPENGLQVVMFTHQSGSIWADMANIVWASGLHVTAAWYVVTETDSALRAGSYVKGTVLLVLRKRAGVLRATRDDLAWEIQEEVESQVQSLAGLNQVSKGRYRDENVFEDADIQMAGYAAALRVLTRYGVIDGRDMAAEAIRPRVKGETTFVDELIAFAVDTANQCLVPQGLPKNQWDRLSGPERFYLKMLDMEARGAKTLDNYQNFAKAFKVRDFKPLMSSQKANDARLRSAVEFGRAEMSEGSQLHESVLRAVLYGVMELANDVDSGEVLTHLTLNVPNYYSDSTQRHLAVELADYLAKRLEPIRSDEASAARVLRDLVKNQRLG